MTPMAQILRDTDGEAERGGYPQISQMTQILPDGVATSSSPVRNIAWAMRASLCRNSAQPGSEH
jgi:hypothetical protein